MIDQAVNIDPIQADQQPVKVVAETEKSSPANTSSTKNEIDELGRKQSEALRRMITSLGSRGSIMLRAALSDRNRQTPAGNRSQLSEQTTKPSEAQQAVGTTTPPVNRERSSKNKVIFTDPVVSRKYEYEPTPVIQHLSRENRPCSSSDSDESDQQQQLAHPHHVTPSRRALLKRRKRLLAARQIQPCGQAVAASKKIQVDDEDDDIFVLASSDIPDMLELNKKSPVKRPHELTLTSSEDEEENRSSSIGDDKTGSKSSSSQDDGCLFSSPKVAKIAPYYHDELEDMDKLNLSSECGSVSKKNALSSLHAAPMLRSYLPISFATKSNQIQSSVKTIEQQQSIFGFFGSIWSQTTSYLFPGSS